MNMIVHSKGQIKSKGSASRSTLGLNMMPYVLIGISLSEAPLEVAVPCNGHSVLCESLDARWISNQFPIAMMT
jgi:hypothetical protein